MESFGNLIVSFFDALVTFFTSLPGAAWLIAAILFGLLALFFNPKGPTKLSSLLVSVIMMVPAVFSLAMFFQVGFENAIAIGITTIAVGLIMLGADTWSENKGWALLWFLFAAFVFYATYLYSSAHQGFWYTDLVVQFSSIWDLLFDSLANTAQ